MFQKKNQKLQFVIFVWSLINIGILILAFIGFASVLFSGLLKAILQTASMGQIGGSIQGYDTLNRIFQMILIATGIVAFTNFFFAIYSIVEMIRFRTKYSVISSVLTIIISLGITCWWDLTRIPRMAEKLWMF